MTKQLVHATLQGFYVLPENLGEAIAYLRARLVDVPEGSRADAAVEIDTGPKGYGTGLIFRYTRLETDAEERVRETSEAWRRERLATAQQTPDATELQRQLGLVREQMYQAHVELAQARQQIAALAAQLRVKEDGP